MGSRQVKGEWRGRGMSDGYGGVGEREEWGAVAKEVGVVGCGSEGWVEGLWHGHGRVD